MRALRRVVTGALELERAEKRIGSSLQAAPHVHVAPEYLAAMKGLDLAEICITSGGDLVEGEAPAGAFSLPDVAGVAVVPALATGEKCARCWQVLEEVGKSARHPLICQRCEGAVEASHETRIDRQAMVLVVATLVIDQLTKQLLLGYLLKAGTCRAGDRRLLSAGHRLEPRRELRPAGRRPPLPAWLLSGVAIAVCVGLFFWLRRTDRPLTGWGIGLVMGGAIGNVIDRARWGAVFDFADFHVRQWHWPAFNVADSAIVVGVGLMLIDSLIGEKQRAP